MEGHCTVANPWTFEKRNHEEAGGPAANVFPFNVQHSTAVVFSVNPLSFLHSGRFCIHPSNNLVLMAG